MRRSGRVAAAFGLAALLFALGAVGLFRSVRSDPAAVPAGAADALVAGPAPAPTALARTVAALQSRVREEPGDAAGLAALGLAYITQARVTADSSAWPKAEEVLRRSLALRPSGNAEASLGLGALALARHDFADALAWAKRARAIDPYDADALGVVGDALVELGRYDAAFATFQDMVDLRPSLASYARAAYALELQGDVPGAVDAMTLAYGAAGTAEDAAWAAHQLGELRWNAGRLGPAERWYERATGLAPEYVPARAGLAKVAAARGRTDAAVREYRAVVASYPLPEYVAAFGDLLAASGDAAGASNQYDLVRAEQRLLAANGGNADLEAALFDADHGRPMEALAAARAEWARRESVHAADALAWALYANGRYDEAMGYARDALRLGTRSAMFRYHAGMIANALGDRAAARRYLTEALETNPHFSLLAAPVAARTLADLEGSR